MTVNWKKNNYVCYVALCLFGACLFQSCGESGTMNSTAAVEKALSQVGKVDKDKYQILELTWREGEKLSNDLRFVDVVVLGQDGKRYSQQFDIQEDKELSFTELDKYAAANLYYKAPDYKPLNVSEEIKAENIVQQMNSAIEQLPEDFAFESVFKYHIEKEIGSGELKGSIILRVTKKGEGKEVTRRSITTTYYEILFNVAPDGTVTIDLDE